MRQSIWSRLVFMTLQAHAAAVAADDPQPRRRHREADAGRVPRLCGDAVGRGDTRQDAAAQRMPVPWCACSMLWALVLSRTTNPV